MLNSHVYHINNGGGPEHLHAKGTVPLCVWSGYWCLLRLLRDFGGFPPVLMPKIGLTRGKQGGKEEKYAKFDMTFCHQS